MSTRWRILSLLLIATLLAGLAASLAPARAGVAAAAPAAQECANLVNNGGFEIDFGWEFDPSATPPQYVNTVARSDNRSLQLGIANTPNVSGLSSARQLVSIPPDASSAILAFWYYPIVEASPGADSFEFSVLSADGTTTLAGPWPMQIGYEWWNQALFDFSLWRGQTFQLAFRVLNDGTGGRTVVFLDDVSLATCAIPIVTPTPSFTPWPTPTLTPWPSPWPTPWPTSWPTPPVGGCVDVLQNGSFTDQLFGWMPGNNPLPPSAVGVPALTPPFAAGLGSTVQNLNAFSSIRQTVNIPPGNARTFVAFWVYTWAESLSGNDRQQFVLLGPGNVVWATPWKVLESAQAWQQHLYEIIGAPSPTFDVYFAAVNDGAGGRTALHVDEVHVWSCPVGAMPYMEAPLAAPAAEPFAFSDASATTQIVPLTPDAALFVEPPVAPVVEPPVAPLAVPPALETAGEIVTPIVVPFAGPEGTGARGALPSASPAPQGTPIDVTGLPSPEWTEVTIVGQPVATLAAQVTAVPPVATLPPPEARMVATSAANPQASGTQAVAPTPTPTPAPTGPVAKFLDTISERTEQWPIAWYWVLLIIVVVVVFLIWLLRRGSRRPEY